MSLAKIQADRIDDRYASSESINSGKRKYGLRYYNFILTLDATMNERKEKPSAKCMDTDLEDSDTTCNHIILMEK
ncbi:hypothetical protein NPIL_39741 [Nephila pilipes]|uniref:Uncharacterized protein n=1 Tax=Nephila pilipes TaxID=299642 RepID=A0A8X6NLT4_NEPPI|nr:hypothetical protein NPIL_39741 [Nephila pilipes]